jgi:hypothetical protein
VTGEAYSAVSQRWYPFHLDLRTGDCRDGVYVDDMSRAIELGPDRKAH